VRTFNCLYVKRREKWLGVNLGGWLLLERGPSQPLFEDQGIPGDEEWGFCEALRKQGTAEAVLAAHRARHFTEASIAEMKGMGLNAVRLPFGYWVVTGPSHGDPYVGPCLNHVDDCVNWCQKHGLQVRARRAHFPRCLCSRALAVGGLGGWVQGSCQGAAHTRTHHRAPCFQASPPAW